MATELELSVLRISRLFAVAEAVGAGLGETGKSRPRTVCDPALCEPALCAHCAHSVAPLRRPNSAFKPRTRLMHAVHAQHALLLDALDGHDVHLRA